MYLFDTNIISELRKMSNSKIDPNVSNWIAQICPEDTYISVISIMEMRAGIMQKMRKDLIQGNYLQHWYDNVMLPAYQGRILPITAKVATICAELHVPNKRPTNDALIAATAMAHNYTLVTRNTKDFQGLKMKLFNPFLDENE